MEWRWVKGYKYLYKVSNKGKIWSDTSSKFLKPWKDKDRYLRIHLCKQGVRKGYGIHKLVASAYLGKCPKYGQVMHLDGDPNNCDIINLSYGTIACNQAMRSTHGTRGHKLTWKQVQKIRKLAKKYTRQHIASKYNVSKCHITNIVNFKQRIKE